MQDGIIIKLIKHKSARSVSLSFYEDDFPKNLPLSSVLNRNVDCEVKDKYRGLIKKPTLNDFIRVIKQTGIWGFCKHVNKEKKEIHYWSGKRATAEKTIEFLGHELSHVYGIKSEQIAQKYGTITKQAFTMFRDLR